MKHGCLAAVLAAVLLCSGCGTVFSRETGGTAVVSLLGVEKQGEQYRIFAAAENRGEETGPRFSGQGEGLAVALSHLKARGSQPVNCAHVEHILLAEDSAAALPELLQYGMQTGEQSTESFLWLVRGEALEQVFGEDRDPALRMEVLKTLGEGGQGFTPLTLRRGAARLAWGGGVLLPTLRAVNGSLEFCGYGVWGSNGLVGFLWGEDALGAALLAGESVAWTVRAAGVSTALCSTGTQVIPVFQRDRVSGLHITVTVEVQSMEGPGTKEEVLAAVEKKVTQQLSSALAKLQELDTDGAGLKGQAGLARPLKWNALSQQWEVGFLGLEGECSVATKWIP